MIQITVKKTENGSSAKIRLPRNNNRFIIHDNVNVEKARNLYIAIQDIAGKPKEDTVKVDYPLQIITTYTWR